MCFQSALTDKTRIIINYNSSRQAFCECRNYDQGHYYYINTQYLHFRVISGNKVVTVKVFEKVLLCPWKCLNSFGINVYEPCIELYRKQQWVSKWKKLSSAPKHDVFDHFLLNFSKLAWKNRLCLQEMFPFASFNLLIICPGELIPIPWMN